MKSSYDMWCYIFFVMLAILTWIAEKLKYFLLI